MTVLRRFTQFCVPCDAFVFDRHVGHGTRVCALCGTKLTPTILVAEGDHQAVVEALRAKLAEMELHDDLPDSHDIGYMAAWREIRDALDAIDNMEEAR